MALNEQAALGTILPDVSIKKMIINDSNDYFLHQRYPHVMHPTENQPSPASTGLSVKIMLSMKDTLNNAYGEYLFNSLELEKYLRIVVHKFDDSTYQGQDLSASRLKQIFNGMSNADKHKFLSNTMNSGYDSSVNVFSVSDVLKSQFSVKPAKSDRRFYEIPFETVHTSLNGNPRNLFFVAHTALSYTAIAEDYDLQGSDESGQFSNFFHHSFEGADGLVGAPTFGIVYENGSVKKTTHVFYTPSGQIWTGPLHYHPNAGYMAGAQHKSVITAETVDPSEAHFPLIRSVKKNLKIQDLRRTNKIDAFLPNFLYDFNKNIADPLRIKNLGQDPVDSLNNTSKGDNLASNGYVSDPLITIDPGANPRVFFTLDMLQLARDRFKYGSLLSETISDGPLSSLKFESHIFQHEPIQQIQVIRQKVINGEIKTDEPEQVIGTITRNDDGALVSNMDMYLSETLAGPEIFSSITVNNQIADRLKNINYIAYRNLVRHGIAPTHKNINKIVKKTDLDTYGQAFDQINHLGATPIIKYLSNQVGSLKELTHETKLAGTTKKLRSFVFVDLNAKRSAGAGFKYKVRLILNDITIDAVQDLLQTAQLARISLERYHEMATMPGVFESESMSFTEQFVDMLSTPGINLLPSLGFSGQSSESVAAIFKIMLRFLSAALPQSEASFFASEENNDPISESVFDSLVSFIHPTSATPESIRSFLELYDKIYSLIASVTNMKNFSRNTATEGSTPKIKTSNGSEDFIQIDIDLKNASGNSLTYTDKQKDMYTLRQPMFQEVSFEMLSTKNHFNPDKKTKDSISLKTHGLVTPSNAVAEFNYGNHKTIFGNTAYNIANLKRISYSDLVDRKQAEIEYKLTAPGDENSYSIEESMLPGPEAGIPQYFIQDVKDGFYTFNPNMASSVDDQTAQQAPPFYFTPSQIGEFYTSGYFSNTGQRRHYHKTNLNYDTRPTNNTIKPTAGDYLFEVNTAEYYALDELKALFLQMLAEKLLGMDDDISYPDVFMGIRTSFDYEEQNYRARSNLAYITSKVALMLGMNPNENVLRSVTRAFQNNLDRDSLSDFFDDKEALLDNVAGQFLNENAHTALGAGSDDDFIEGSVSNFGLGNEAVSKKINTLYYIVICMLFKKMFGEQKLGSYDIQKAGNVLIEALNQAQELADDSASQKDLRFQTWQQLPPQIKFLIVSDAANTTTPELRRYTNNTDIFNYRTLTEFFMLTSIYKVQYLQNYSTNTENNKVFSLKDSNFVDLTPNAVAQLQGKTLLCRFQRYINPIFCYNLEDKININIFDKYFLLDAPVITEAAPSDAIEEPFIATPAGGIVSTGDGTAGTDDAPLTAEEEEGQPTGGFNT